MPTIDNADVEAEARALLRERIERSPWYPGLLKDERRARIEGEVERFWGVMVEEAVQNLLDRALAPSLEAPQAVEAGGFEPRRRRIA